MLSFRSTNCALFALVLCACTTGGDISEPSRAANKYLWDASLDTLSFLPLEQADDESGLLVTGWGSVEGSQQVYRATILVSDADLDAQSLKVAVFRRLGQREVAASPQTILEVENAILTRARQLRIDDIRG